MWRWIFLLLLCAVLLGSFMRYRLKNEQERRKGAPLRRLFFMLLVTVLIVGYSMHYRTESMSARGRDDAFRESYLAGQAQRAAGLPMEEHWKSDFDSQAYFYLAHGPFNDIMPYCHARLFWQGCGYEKGYLGQTPRIAENGKLIDLTVPFWHP